jgi:hypothetical protein
MTDIHVEHLPDRLRVHRGDRLAFNYVYRGTWRPYFWPLNLPQGSVVRGVTGREHHNHYGVSLAYGGHRSDTTTSIWSDWDEPEYGPCGRMLHEQFDEVRAENDVLHVRQTTGWTGETGHAIGGDTRRYEVRFWPDGELLVLARVTAPPPNDPDPGPVMLLARAADSLRVDPRYDEAGHTPGQIVNDAGARGEEATCDEPARWVDYAGEVGDGHGGITLISHPENPAHPSPFLTRAYGVFRSEQPFEHDDVHTFRWGAYVHTGLTEHADIERAVRAVSEW